MRRHLNNPVIVLPLALIASLWGAYSYGLFDLLTSKFFNHTVVESNPPERLRRVQESKKRSAAVMRSLIGDSWLTTNWIRDSAIKNEPFVADYDFEKDLIPEMAENETVEKPEELVIVDQETFAAAIASRLGLDGDGFFVVFENVLNLPVRKRVGDEIYLREGGLLKIPTFGIAERSRAPEEQRVAVESALAKMKLQGVGTETPDLIKGEAAAAENNEKNIAFIQVDGASLEIYRQGELVHRNPSLGLDKILKGDRFDRVILVDVYQNEYELRTADAE